MSAASYFALADCKVGHVYAIRSRNLQTGVFTERGGFIGIREKFGSRYLFEEYHWDKGPPYGTVHPFEDICVLPEGIVIAEDLGSHDEITGRPTDFEEDRIENGVKVASGRGWYFKDTGEANEAIRSCRKSNKPLFDYLDSIEKERR